MRLPLTLSLYVGRQFLIGFVIALMGLLLIAHFIELVELVRRTNTRESLSFFMVWEMAALKIPRIMQDILPYAMLVGSMLALTRLTRTQELVIARAAGISVWQFLAPALAMALGFGLFFIMIFNPFLAAMSLRYDTMEARYLKGRPSLLAISTSGLWLRQMEGDGTSPTAEHIIHAERIAQKDMGLSDVVVFAFSHDNSLLYRVDAKSATLEPGQWHLHDVSYSVPGAATEERNDYILPTTFSMQQIQDSFASPYTLSFWELPGFITMLQDAGFSAIAHRLYWQGLLATPLMLAAMVLVAAVFSLRQHRQGKIGWLMAAGIVAGVLIHLMSNLVEALGESASVPVVMAAWVPAVSTVMFGVAMLLHLEDG